MQELDAAHRLYQDAEGFSFGTDAVLLAGFLRFSADAVGVELGTGTGIIPLLLSIHRSFQKIYALEIQKDSAALAEENIKMNGFSEKVAVLCHDLKEALPALCGKADFVFSNPPYMKEAVGKLPAGEKKSIARHEICCTVEDVCRAAARFLKDRGDFFVIYRTERLAALIAALKAARLEPKEVLFVSPKPSDEPRLFLLRAVKGGGEGLRIHKTLVLQDEKGTMTERVKRLYENGVLEKE